MTLIGNHRRDDDPRLHGRWEFGRTEDPATELVGGAQMEFCADGKLLYTMKHASQPFEHRLSYEVDGLEIVAKQTAEPEIRARYAFDDQGNLVVEFRGWRTWYRRLTEGAG